ncbi:MAG: YqgE/AlgH family protein [Alphaproteobacteria bacterium]|nr:YqgE/AlgH family protein [Alphaproteobacteria bacterium]
MTDNFDNKYSLAGKFLIASPTMDNGGIFDKSLVFVCSHGRNGAMGIVVNKRLDEFTFSDLTFQLPIENYTKLNQISLYQGGPLEKVRGLVLHTSDYVKDGTIVVSNGIAVSSSNEIIADIAFDRGPEKKLVALGYSFWQPRQLEAEIFENYWFVADANTDLLFAASDEEKWQRAMDETKINLERFVGITGHA